MASITIYHLSCSSSHSQVWLIVSHRQGQTGSKYHPKDQYPYIHTSLTYTTGSTMQWPRKLISNLANPRTLDPTPKRAPTIYNRRLQGTLLNPRAKKINKNKNIQLTQYSTACLHSSVSYICTSHIIRVTRNTIATPAFNTTNATQKQTLSLWKRHKPTWVIFTTNVGYFDRLYGV